MSGVSNFYVPTTDEILLGDYKLYGNFGLPTQFILGYINESFKLTITREFKQIKVNGAFCNTLDANGIPMIRILRLVPMITIESLALRYINNNIITGAESTDNWESGNWAGGDGAYTAETSIVQTGAQSAKLTGDADGEGIHEVFSSSKDLTTFSNGISGTVDDKICFAIYVTTSELAKLNTGLTLKIHCDSEGTETNYYYYDIAKTSLTADAWANFTPARDDFTSAGGGAEDWATVTGISLVFDGLPTSEAVVYIDSVSLLQDSTQSAMISVSGSGGKFTYTDEGTYKEFTPYLPIPDSAYLDNIGLVGQSHSGKRLDIILENALDDGSINIAIQEKTEVVNSVQFTGHYRRTAPTTVPLEFRHYKTVS